MPSQILEGDAEVEVCGCGHFSFWLTRQGLTKQRRRHARVAGIEVHDRGVVQGGGVHEQSDGVRRGRNVTLSGTGRTERRDFLCVCTHKLAKKRQKIPNCPHR